MTESQQAQSIKRPVRKAASTALVMMGAAMLSNRAALEPLIGDGRFLIPQPLL